MQAQAKELHKIRAGPTSDYIYFRTALLKEVCEYLCVMQSECRNLATVPHIMVTEEAIQCAHSSACLHKAG